MNGVGEERGSASQKVQRGEDDAARRQLPGARSPAQGQTGITRTQRQPSGRRGSRLCRRVPGGPTESTGAWEAAAWGSVAVSHRPHLSGLKPQRPVWLCTLVLCSVGSLVGKGCPGLGWRVQRQVVHSLGCCEAAEGWGRGAVGAARASWSCGAGHPRQGPLEPRGRGTAPRCPEGHQQGPARLTQGGGPTCVQGCERQACIHRKPAVGRGHCLGW